MKVSISAPLQAHLDSRCTSLACCWRVVLQNGTVFAFTNHDVDIVFNGRTYLASSGYTASSLETSDGMEVDNMELSGIIGFDSSTITEADLDAGLWDRAEVEIFLVNWADLTQGRIMLPGGTLGEVSVERGRYTSELRGITQAYSKHLLELTSPTCRADVGDARCGKDMTDYTVTGSVTSSSGKRTFNTDLASKSVRLSPTSVGTPGLNYFAGGKLTWLTGDNAGYSMEVKSYTVGGQVELHQPMPNTVDSSDTFTVHAGCNKIGRLGDCVARFGNYRRFRGEEDLPGIDSLMQVGGR